MTNQDKIDQVLTLVGDNRVLIQDLIIALAKKDKVAITFFTKGDCEIALNTEFTDDKWASMIDKIEDVIGTTDCLDYIDFD